MQKNIDFSKYSSIKIGPVADVKIVTREDKYFNDLFIVGGANNLLISNNPPKLAILSKEFDFIYKKNNFLHVGAATPSGKIISFAKKHNIGGFEILQRLPGQLGGMLKMNAGLQDFSISDNLLKILTCSGEYAKEECGFEYRKSNIYGFIFEAIFEIKNGFNFDIFEKFKISRANQPNQPSAGSCFKNPNEDFAGRLLEQCGFKGKKLNNISFSEIHANFLVNLGGATFEDAITLIKEAQSAVYDKFNIKLELEIKIADKQLSNTTI